MHTKPGFTHLEVHSHFSLLEGTAAVADLAGRAAVDGLTHLALTDTNALYGVVAFARACHSAAIQPILGLTITAALPPNESPIRPPGEIAGQPGHLVLLATGPAGYRSLCRLSSFIQGSPGRETLMARGVDWDALRAYREGLICLSGGRWGWLERFLRTGNRAAADRYAARLGGIFDENAWLTLELHSPLDQAIAHEVLAMGKRFGLPVAAVQPIYCLSPQDRPHLRLLEKLRGQTSDVSETSDVSAHWLSPDEMATRFADFPEALDGVAEIIGRCRPALPDGGPLWPALPVRSSGFSRQAAEAATTNGNPRPVLEDSKVEQRPEEKLAADAEAGLLTRYGPAPPAAVTERLQRELAALNDQGYAALFLMAADVVRFAHQSEIPVSTRGSVANSLVAYCLGITTVDPIAHDLLFERFLNPARANPPDIDLDLCSRRRDEVLAYVHDTYGRDHVALVGMMSTLQPRSAVRELARVSNRPLAESDVESLVRAIENRVGTALPSPSEGEGLGERVSESPPHSPRLGGEPYPSFYEAAARLVGQPHHLSLHPGGVVVTPGPLTDVAPVQWTPKGFLATQYDYQDAEAVGLPKLDLLGNRALTTLAGTAAWIRRYDDPAFSLDGIPLDDALTGDLLARGETIGVFQCESAGAQRTLRQLQARTVSDLAIANAFFKPGPAMGGMVRTFIRRFRERGQGQGSSSIPLALHPALEPILRSTYGVLLFQEQVLRVATEIAGLSWAEADYLRRGMSKMQPERMAVMQERFIQGCQRPAPDGPGFTPEQARQLWEQVLAFGGYGFNRGHATAYADLSYRSAYLKAHWPAAFLVARLVAGGGFHDPAIYIAEAIRLDLAVRPPHVNHSDHAFTLEVMSDESRVMSGSSLIPHPSSLFMGLGQVRDLRYDTIQAIVSCRQQRPFRDLADLLERVPLQAKEWTHLIQCGALDGLGSSRAALLVEAGRSHRAGTTRQLSFAFAEPEPPSDTAAQRLAWEQHVLGQPVSVHPLDVVADQLQEVTPLRQVAQQPGRLLTVAGVRLPGWTGGPGFFLADQQTYLVARGDKNLKTPKPWQPLLLRGRWREDEWGTGWLQLAGLEPLDKN